MKLTSLHNSGLFQLVHKTHNHQRSEEKSEAFLAHLVTSRESHVLHSVLHILEKWTPIDFSIKENVVLLYFNNNNNNTNILVSHKL